MYHSNGNYEAFARPLKPEGVEQKSAYLVGAGLASLAAAVFLIRDGQMPGERIHIFEELSLPGGSLDGILDAKRGFVIRGGREMENHFECLWDLFRSVPSLEVADASVLDEFYWLNKKDPNRSLMRATQRQGQDGGTDGKFTLSDKASMEMIELFLTAEDQLDDLKITDVFSDDFFRSNFWLYWRTMFAFEEWHSATEMRRYIARFIHHIGGLPDLSALKFTKYNQYESLVLPLRKYLEQHGVAFHYGKQVQNLLFQTLDGQKVATGLVVQGEEGEQTLPLTKEDLVFVTNGSITESSTLGDHHTPAQLNAAPGGSWSLWQNLARQDQAFGRPEKFCGDIDATKFVSATLTTLDGQVPPYIEKICRRDPFGGGVVTGGIVSVEDSSWLMSWTLNRQPHFAAQPKDQLVVWIYGLFCDRPGDYVKKTMQECTGEEIAREWLYHLGVPVQQIDEMAKSATNCVPCMMPYVMSYFMPRARGDRPQVVPEGCYNLAFIGNFAETQRDTVFTTEYSVRTAMEAVYTLLAIDRGVPEVFASCYDVRVLLDSTHKLMDGRKLTDLKLPFQFRWLERKGLEKTKGTVIEELLKEANLI